MPEREQTAKPQEEIDRHREETPHEDVEREDRVEDPRETEDEGDRGRGERDLAATQAHDVSSEPNYVSQQKILAGDAREHSDQEPRSDRALDRAHPADHDDREREDDELGPHERRHVPHRRGEDARERGETEAEPEHGGGPAIDIDPERARQLGALRRSAHDHPEARALDRVPDRERDRERERDDE